MQIFCQSGIFSVSRQFRNRITAFTQINARYMQLFAGDPPDRTRLKQRIEEWRPQSSSHAEARASLHSAADFLLCLGSVQFRDRSPVRWPSLWTEPARYLELLQHSAVLQRKTMRIDVMFERPQTPVPVVRQLLVTVTSMSDATCVSPPSFTPENTDFIAPSGHARHSFCMSCGPGGAVFAAGCGDGGTGCGDSGLFGKDAQHVQVPCFRHCDCSRDFVSAASESDCSGP